MRGKGEMPSTAFFVFRITPAYAGKRITQFLNVHLQKDHPRLCGEKVPHSANGGFPVRITPAYAGKRDFFLFDDVHQKDHPRLCGEKS